MIPPNGPALWKHALPDGRPSVGAWKVLIAVICGEGAAFLSGTKATPCGEPKVKPGAFCAETSAVKTPVFSST